MLQSLLNKNQSTIKLFMTNGKRIARNSFPILRMAIPVGGFVLWAAWPAAGDTIMGRNIEEEK